MQEMEYRTEKMENGSEERERESRVRWEGLMNEEKSVKYEEKTRQKL